LTREYVWTVCHGPDGEVMGAVGMPVLTPEETEALALKRREWRDRMYPGPATGRDPEAVRLIAERKREGGS
jgi:hypothetical protein